MDDVVYVGQSQALHWWPDAMIVLAIAGVVPRRHSG